MSSLIEMTNEQLINEVLRLRRLATAEQPGSAVQGEVGGYAFENMHVTQYADPDRGIEGKVEWRPDASVDYPSVLLKNGWVRNIRPLYTTPPPAAAAAQQCGKCGSTLAVEDHNGKPLCANCFCATEPLDEAAAAAEQSIDRARFCKAPCYLCGYNGEGYYQPSTHPCASKFHGSQPEARGVERFEAWLNAPSAMLAAAPSGVRPVTDEMASLALGARVPGTRHHVRDYILPCAPSASPQVVIVAALTAALSANEVSRG